MSESGQAFRPAELTMWDCFRHFAHLDHSNAAIHSAAVRYSPITFRLAEALDRPGMRFIAVPNDPVSHALLDDVLSHRGAYEEDRGR